MRRRPGRTAIRHGAAGLLLSALCAVAGPAAGESAWDGYLDSFGEPRLTGTRGSYAVLLDDRRELLRGAYWVGPATVILLEPPLGNIIPTVLANEMVDRTFLPGVRLSAYLLQANRVVYLSMPPPPQAREPATFGALPFALSFVGPPKPHARTEVTFRWTGSETRRFGETEVTAFRYEATGLYLAGDASLAVAETAEPRVYLPAVGLDITAEQWARAATLIAGTGLVSSADLAFEVWLKQPIDAGMRDCLETLRAAGDTLAFSHGIALLETRTEGLLPVGRNDILEYGISEYQDLEESFHVMERFQTCLGT